MGAQCELWGAPLWSEYGTHKAATTRFWPWIAGRSPQTFTAVPSSFENGRQMSNGTGWAPEEAPTLRIGYYQLRPQTSNAKVPLSLLLDRLQSLWRLTNHRRSWY